MSFTCSGIREKIQNQPRITNDQHSFLLCIFSKATWRTKWAFSSESSGWWLGRLPVFAATLARFPPRNSSVKGNMLHIEFDTHTAANTHADCNKSRSSLRGRDESSESFDRHLVWAVVKPDKSSNPLTNSAVSLITYSHLFIKMHFFKHTTKRNNKLILKLKCPNSSVNTGHCIILALLAATLLEKKTYKQKRLSNGHPAN